jgi:ABC-2 type transport system permease protein
MNTHLQRSVRAETLKLLSLPATHLTALGALVTSVVLAIAFGAAGRQGGTGTTSVLDVGIAPVGYSQAGFIILGVVTATSEYSGGQIYTTLTAMPRRITQHLAKFMSLAVFAVPAAVVTVVAGVVVAGLLVAGNASPPTFSDALSVIAGTSAYLTLTALLSAAVAAVVRRTVPAVAGLLVYYFIAGPLLRDHAGFATYLPDTAGYSMWFHSGAGRFGALSAFTGSVVVVAWVALAAAISTTAFRHRDA